MAAGRPWARLGEQRENAMGETDDRDGTAVYNYAHFDDYVAAGGDVADEEAFWASPRAGQRAPDFTQPRLGDGADITLSDMWRSKPLVMEFGSFT
jgi:hypothetical protein